MQLNSIFFFTDIMEIWLKRVLHASVCSLDMTEIPILKCEMSYDDTLSSRLYTKLQEMPLASSSQKGS